MKRVLQIGLALMVVSAGLEAALPNYRKVNLTCANPGSHQDVAKTPIITNSTRTPIAATVKVYWTATDGDHGYVQGPFAVNQSKSALGTAGNGYQCSAYYWVKIF